MQAGGGGVTMHWRQPDPLRWRNRFAWRPRLIGTQWIWLERYSYRLVPADEQAERHPLPGFYRPCWLEEFRCGGLTSWRLNIAPMSAMLPIARMWVRVGPRLRIVA